MPDFPPAPKVAKFTELSQFGIYFFKRGVSLGYLDGTGAWGFSESVGAAGEPVYGRLLCNNVSGQWVCSYGVHNIGRLNSSPALGNTPYSKVVFEGKAMLEQLGGCAISFGLMSGNVLKPNSTSAIFLYDSDVGANIYARTYDSAEELTDTGIAADTSWHLFRIEIRSDVKFYIDGSLVATHTTQVPASQGGNPYAIRIVKAFIITHEDVYKRLRYGYVAVWAE